jgi:hypothetical protein
MKQINQNSIVWQWWSSSLKGQGQFNPLAGLVQKVVLSMFVDNPFINYQVTVNYSINQLKFNNLTFKVKVINKPRSIYPNKWCVFIWHIENINSNLNGILSIDDVKVFLLLFADDGALFAYDPQSLQSMLNDVQTYCNTWRLRLNVSKTKIMIFENGRHTSYDFSVRNLLWS